jgi:hypothetical protein
MQEDAAAPRATLPRSAAVNGPTSAELRRKLDAAIMAEAWDAVRAIQRRIADVEIEEVGRDGKLVDLDAERSKRGSR